MEFELKIIVERGDRAQSILENSDSEEELVETQESTTPCRGYLNLHPKEAEKCTERGSPHLWITEAKQQRFFCKPSHLLRYLLKEYCAKGKKVEISEEEKESKEEEEGEEGEEEEEEEDRTKKAKKKRKRSPSSGKKKS